MIIICVLGVCVGILKFNRTRKHFHGLSLFLLGFFSDSLLYHEHFSWSLFTGLHAHCRNTTLRQKWSQFPWIEFWALEGYLQLSLSVGILWDTYHRSCSLLCYFFLWTLFTGAVLCVLMTHWISVLKECNWKRAVLTLVLTAHYGYWVVLFCFHLLCVTWLGFHAREWQMFLQGSTVNLACQSFSR